MNEPRPVFLPQSVQDFAKVLMQNSQGKTEAVTKYLQEALKLKPSIMTDRLIDEKLQIGDRNELLLCYKQYINRRIKETIAENVGYDGVYQILLNITRADFLVLLESVPKKYNDRLMKEKISTVRNNIDCILDFHNEKHIKHIFHKGTLTITADNVVKAVKIAYPIVLVVKGNQRKVLLQLNATLSSQ